MTRRGLVAVWAAVLVVGLAGGSGRVQGGELDWLTRATLAPSPNFAGVAPGTVVFDRTELLLSKDLRVEIRRKLAIRIVDSAALDRATLIVALPPGSRLVRLKAWSVSANGVRSNAGIKDAVQSEYAPGFYTDTRRAAIRPPEVVVGDVVGFESAVQTTLPFPRWLWMPQDPVFNVASAQLVVDVPTGWRVSIRARGIEVRERVEPAGARSFEIGPTGPPASEPGAPPMADCLAAIRLAFSGPDGVSTFGDWASIAAWYHGVAAPRFARSQAPEELDQRVAAGSRIQALSALAREVQHQIGYAAIELGDQAWVPDAARDTWQRRYGDCKDKATLLVAALEARGITARPVLTCTRGEATVDSGAPDPSQFNHCIVAVRWPGPDPPQAVTAPGPSGRAWTFFDPTSESIPLGLLPDADAGAWAVIADSSEGLVRLPARNEMLYRVTIHAAIDPNGSLEGSAVLTGEGLAGALLAAAFARTQDATSRAQAAGLLAAPGITPEILEVQCGGLDSTRFVTTVQLKFRARGAVRRLGSGLLLRPLHLFAQLEPASTDSARTLPFVLGGPTRIEERLELELPQGYRPEEVTPRDWQGPAGAYHLEGRTEGSLLAISRLLVLLPEIVPAARFREVVELQREAYAGDASAILLR